jgi:hypothetical protein
MQRFRFLMAVALVAALVGCARQTPNNDQPTASSSQPSTDTSANSAAPATAPQPTLKKRSAESSAPRTVVIPAGTVVTVRLGQAVGSKISRPGESFAGTIARPVEVNGTVAIPSGADASGVITDAKPLGRFKGGARLQIALRSVTVNGTRYDVAAAPVTREVKGKGKRSAVMIGGGAGAGALIGGLIGGGKGAAIGAASGAGAGTAGTAFTGNKEIVIGAETPVTFRITKALNIRK